MQKRLAGHNRQAAHTLRGIIRHDQRKWQNPNGLKVSPQTIYEHLAKHKYQARFLNTAAKAKTSYPQAQIRQQPLQQAQTSHLPEANQPYTVASACSRSASKSSVDSIPQLKRTISGEIPQATSSSSFIWRCVALAGCSTHVRASATCVAI